MWCGSSEWILLFPVSQTLRFSAGSSASLIPPAYDLLQIPPSRFGFHAIRSAFGALYDAFYQSADLWVSLSKVNRRFIVNKTTHQMTDACNEDGVQRLVARTRCPRCNA